MAFKKTGSIRYPYTGDLYSAEGRYRIRVERDGKWGYFDDRANWLEGEVRFAEPCMCRFISSTWVIDHAPKLYGLTIDRPRQVARVAPGRHGASQPSKARGKTPPRKAALKAPRGRSK